MLAMRRAGGARSRGRQKCCAEHSLHLLRCFLAHAAHRTLAVVHQHVGQAFLFVSGQLCLGGWRANSLVNSALSRRTNKAVARVCHRRNWPETDVGASLLAMRRAGGARSHGRQKTIARHLEAILQFPDDHLAAITRTHKNHHKSPNYQLGPTSPRTISYVHANPKELSYTPCRRPSDCPGKACSLG